MTDIRAFKLKTGEELVAEVTTISDDNETYTIKNPVFPTQQGFVPWFGLSEERNFELHSRDLVVPPSQPVDELTNSYKQIFNIGIISAGSPQLIRG